MHASDIETINMRTGSWGKIRAYATITFTNGMKVEGFKVIQGSKGLFVGSPSVQKKNKETGDMDWRDVVFFPEEEDRKAFSEAVLEHYNSKRTGSDSGGSFKTENKTTPEGSGPESEWWT